MYTRVPHLFLRHVLSFYNARGRVLNVRSTWTTTTANEITTTGLRPLIVSSWGVCLLASDTTFEACVGCVLVFGLTTCERHLTV